MGRLGHSGIGGLPGLHGGAPTMTWEDSLQTPAAPRAAAAALTASVAASVAARAALMASIAARVVSGSRFIGPKSSSRDASLLAPKLFASHARPLASRSLIIT